MPALLQMPACTLRLLLAGAVRNEGKKPVIRAEAGQGWVSQAVLSRADRCVTIGVRLKQMPAISHDCMTFRQTFCVFVVLRRPGKQLKAHQTEEPCCLCVHNRVDDARTFVRISALETRPKSWVGAAVRRGRFGDLLSSGINPIRCGHVLTSRCTCDPTDLYCVFEGCIWTSSRRICFR